MTISSFIRFVVELRDDSELHVFEYIDSSMHKIDYSYHWQDKEKRLITRWDNAPHHPEDENGSKSRAHLRFQPAVKKDLRIIWR